MLDNGHAFHSKILHQPHAAKNEFLQIIPCAVRRKRIAARVTNRLKPAPSKTTRAGRKPKKNVLDRPGPVA